MADGMHDWVLSAERMAKVLADKGYHYRFVFARNSRHVDRPTVAQTFPAALEWLLKGYPILVRVTEVPARAWFGGRGLPAARS